MVNQKDGHLVNVSKYATLASSLKGDFAELGVFRGDSAEEICKIKGDRPLHLFDTFQGLPASTFLDIDTRAEFARRYISFGAFNCPIEAVKKRLSGYPKVYYYSGIFPQTSKPVEKEQFCFVHLDADLHQATFHGIKFFYPRIVKGGLLLIHNYNDFDGVKNAVHTFFKPHEIEEVGYKHCLITRE